MLEALIQLAIIWGVVFVAAFAARKTKLTPVLYYLFFGAVLVNLGVLPSESHEFIRGLGELGIIIIMFAIGFEENTANFISGMKRSWGIAFFGALAPFILAYSIADYFWQDSNLSLMFGLTMTATAVSLTLVSLRQEGLHKSPAATAIMTSAVLDDIGSLALVAILVPIATGDVSVNIVDIFWIVTKAISFFIGIIFLGLWIFPHNPKGIIRHIPFISNIGVKHVLWLTRGQHTILTVLLIALLVGLAAHALGFHPAIGAYMAGLVLKDEYFQLAGHGGSKDNPEIIDQAEQTKEAINSAAFSWIGPIFFVGLGTKIILDMDIIIAVLPQTIMLAAGLIIIQTGSAALAARFTGGFRWPDAFLIGIGMLGRAELAFVVIDIAYVQNSILNEEAFYTLMFAAFWLNVSVPILISLWKYKFSAKSS